MKRINILLTTDFSDNARKAIDYAIYLFEKEPCTFHILNAVQVSPSGLESTRSKAKDTRLFRAITEESQRNVAQVVDELTFNRPHPDHSFEGHSIGDTLVNAVGRIALKEDIDYLFMGTKGSSAVKEVFMGSSTIQVLKHIDLCPIVAVPADYDYDLPDQIVFATNFEHPYSQAELAPLIFVAKLWGSGILVVHVGTDDDLDEQQENAKGVLSERLGELPHHFEEVAGQSKVSGAIMDFTGGRADIGMIAMVNYEHSFIEKLTTERIIKRVAFHTDIPFLILPRIESQ